MKHILVVIAFLYAFSITAQDQIQADVRLFTFDLLDGTHLVEVYVCVISASLLNIDNQDNISVDVKLIVRSGASITSADRYTLSQAKTANKDFYHIQRVQLNPGTYEFEVELTDGGDAERKLTKKLNLKLDEKGDDVSISSLQLLANVETDYGNNAMAKNGLLMEPLKFQYLSSNHKKFQAYAEVYNTDHQFDGDYIVKYDIIHESSDRTDTLLTRYKRRKSCSIDPYLISEVNDTNWASGKYIFSFAVMDFEQNIMAVERSTFVLSNPRSAESEGTMSQSFVARLSDEDLNYALKAIAPKVNTLDIERLNNLISKGSRLSRESFLYRFWSLYSPINPEAMYLEYMEVAKAIDNMYYDGLGYGFETDRGYIYLKYGRPDEQISIENEPTAPPYEIWVYADFPSTRQNNVKFVFYNPAATTYELLHSNARGEINDPQWLMKLYRNSPQDFIGNTIDGREVQDNWGRRAAEIFAEN